MARSCITRALGSALPWVMAAIIAVECWLHAMLPGRYFNHELDVLMRELAVDRHNPAVLIIGDSTGYQFQQPYRLYRMNRFAGLAVNRAVEMAGHYFLVQRYAARHTKPKAIVFMGRNPFGLNLRQAFTENYVQRCFTRWTEIRRLSLARRSPVFAAHMIGYRLLPSYKYRLHLQRLISGSANADIYTGRNTSSEPGSGTTYALFDALGRALLQRRALPISDLYFVRLLQWCEAAGVEFHYIPAPLPASEALSSDAIRARTRAKELAAGFHCFHLREDLALVYPDERFGDGVHLDAKGLDMAHAALDPELWKLQYAGNTNAPAAPP